MSMNKCSNECSKTSYLIMSVSSFFRMQNDNKLVLHECHGQESRRNLTTLQIAMLCNMIITTVNVALFLTSHSGCLSRRIFFDS